jgi:two-component system LytT family response regulator
MRTVVVDDEPLARSGMVKLVTATAGFEVVGQAGDCASAVEVIERTRPDLVLLDVQLPGEDAFAIIRTVGPARMPMVVFVTAHDAFAVRAFEVQALDYVLKPFTNARLRTALQRARTARPGDLARRLEALVIPRPVRFEARVGNRTVLVSASEIDWIEGASYYAVLHAGSEEHLVRETMERIEERLDGARFLRVHRSAIVQLDRVRELRPARSEVVLRDGTAVKVSRARWRALTAALGGAG